jgi:hypothetical protein
LKVVVVVVVVVVGVSVRCVYGGRIDKADGWFFVDAGGLSAEQTKRRGMEEIEKDGKKKEERKRRRRRKKKKKKRKEKEDREV